MIPLYDTRNHLNQLNAVLVKYVIVGIFKAEVNHFSHSSFNAIVERFVNQSYFNELFNNFQSLTSVLKIIVTGIRG